YIDAAGRVGFPFPARPPRDLSDGERPDAAGREPFFSVPKRGRLTRPVPPEYLRKTNVRFVTFGILSQGRDCHVWPLPVLDEGKPRDAADHPGRRAPLPRAVPGR